MIRRTFLILTLIAVGAIILFTRSHQPSKDSRTAGDGAPLQSGYYMTDASIVQTGPDGLPMYTMRADSIRQNPADETLRLRHLELDYRATTPDTALKRTWKLTARQGDMSHQDDASQAATRIDLSGNVELVGQPLSKHDPLVRLRTQRLSMDTQTEIVRTAEKVNFIWGDSELTGTGLTVDLKAETIKLESQVNGRLTQ
jgi:LPS export ABC transporter protein LptC